jgi:type VI secretion system protein VasL
VNNHEKLKTGGDPRALADYAALRDELAKLSHPARPDVNWSRVEQLSLSLFRQNGVELHAAAWYTLARARLAGIAGLNEGLAILKALLTHQWIALWPQPLHARVEILTGFSQRLHAVLRVLALRQADLPLVYQAEQHLNALRDVLARLGVKNAGQVGELCVFMHNAAIRLENMDKSRSDNSAVVLPDFANETASDYMTPFSPLVYAACEEPARPYLIPPLSGRYPWRAFTAGMLTMLALATAGLWGWHNISPPPASPVPATANENALTELSRLSPLWRQKYGFVLAARAEPAEAEKLKIQWQHYLNGNALPLEALSGWHQGMEGLKVLTRRLNTLDERKGKYLTGSELKSMVFAITQDFSRTLPVEEQLYQLSQAESKTPESAALQLQTEMRFNQLLNRYALITQQKENP